jgi:hypothetical protein
MYLLLLEGQQHTAAVSASHCPFVCPAVEPGGHHHPQHVRGPRLSLPTATYRGVQVPQPQASVPGGLLPTLLTLQLIEAVQNQRRVTCTRQWGTRPQTLYGIPAEAVRELPA